MERDFILNGNPNRKLEDYYEMTDSVLGKGSYGVVYRATVKGTRAERAIKVIQKDKVNNVDRFKCEVDIMKSLVVCRDSRTIPLSLECMTSSKTRRMSTWSSSRV